MGGLLGEETPRGFLCHPNLIAPGTHSAIPAPQRTPSLIPEETARVLAEEDSQRPLLPFPVHRALPHSVLPESHGGGAGGGRLQKKEALWLAVRSVLLSATSEKQRLLMLQMPQAAGRGAGMGAPCPRV